MKRPIFRLEIIPPGGRTPRNAMQGLAEAGLPEEEIRALQRLVVERTPTIAYAQYGGNIWYNEDCMKSIAHVLGQMTDRIAERGGHVRLFVVHTNRTIGADIEADFAVEDSDRLFEILASYING